jgi:hypothetical protein
VTAYSIHAWSLSASSILSWARWTTTREQCPVSMPCYLTRTVRLTWRCGPDQGPSFLPGWVDHKHHVGFWEGTTEHHGNSVPYGSN